MPTVCLLRTFLILLLGFLGYGGSSAAATLVRPFTVVAAQVGPEAEATRGPSCYLLVVSDDDRVLLGRKSIIVTRIGGVTLGQPSIPSNPGQWVVPGGSANRGEALSDCAYREFKEETGISRDTLERNRMGPQRGQSFDGFYVEYVRVSSTMLTVLRNEINISLPVVHDDELHEVAVFTRDNAVQSFGPFYPPLPDNLPEQWMKDQYAIARSSASNSDSLDFRLTQPLSDWFVTAVGHIPPTAIERPDKCSSGPRPLC